MTSRCVWSELFRAAHKSGKTIELAGVQIRDRPMRHLALGPMQEVVTLAARLLQAGIGLARRGPDKQIDHVLAPLINQGGHGPVVEVIEAPADQGEATIRKI